LKQAVLGLFLNNIRKKLIFGLPKLSFLLVFLTFSIICKAQIVVTPAPGGSNICVGGDYVSIGDIVISETGVDDFGPNSADTYILTLPANFEFNTSTGTASSNVGDISAISETRATNTFTITFSHPASGASVDAITVSGLEVRAITTSSSGDILESGGTSPVAGNGQIHASLSSVDPPTVTLISSDADDEICAGETVTFTAGGATNYEFFVEGVSVQGPGTSTTYETSSLTDGDEVTVVGTDGNSCTNSPAGITMTVDLTPDVTTDQASYSQCSGAATNIMISNPNSVSGTFYNWTVFSSTNVSGASAGSGSQIIQTLSNTDGVNPGSVTYEITPTSNGCSGTPIQRTVTVNDIPSVPTPINTTLAYCQFEATPASDFQVTGSNLEWYSDATLTNNIHSGPITDPLAEIGLDSSVPGTTIFYVTQSNSGCESTYSTITVTVTAIPVVSTSPTDKTRCEGSNLTFQGTASGTGLSYQWQYNDGVSGWLDVDSGTDAEYSDETTTVLSISNVPLAWDGYQYRLEITGSCGSPVYTGVATLNVNQVPQITSQPTVPTSECEGSGVINLSITKEGTGASTEWEVSTNGGSTWSDLTDDAIYSNSSTDNLTITNAPLSYNNYQYRAVVSGTCGPNAISNAVTIDITENITITTNPVSVTECEGGAVFFSSVATGENLSYQWYEDSGSGFALISNGGIYSGATTNTLNISAISSSMNGNAYRVEVTSAAPCSGSQNSATATLNVEERPEVVDDPDPVLICEGNNTSFTVDVGVTSNPTIQWQVSTNNGSSYIDLSDDATYNGVITETLDITNVTSSLNGNLYRVRVGGDCVPPVLSQAASLTITEVPEVTLNPVDVIVCEGNNAVFSIDMGVTTNPTIQWQEFNGSIWADLSNNGTYSGVNTTLLTILSNSSINSYRYRARVSGDCTPMVFSGDAGLTVTEAPEIVTQPQDSIVCAGIPVAYSVDAGVTAGVSYQWQLNTGSGWSNISDGGIYSGATTDELQISSTDISMNNYLYRVIVGGVCTPSQTSFAASLNVFELTVDQGVDFAICEGNVGVLGGTPTAIGGAGSYTYLWTGFDDATGYSSNAANPAITYSTSGSYRYNVMVEDAFGCSVTSSDIIVTVNAGNIANASTDTVVCEGTPAVTIEGASIGGSATNILWTIESGGSGTLVDETTLTPTYQPTLSEFGTVTLKLTASDPSSCPDVVDFIDIDINRAATVEAGTDAVICEGSSHILNGSLGGSSLSATWTTTGDGTFSFAGDLNATYTPGTNDISNGIVKIYLTTNDPDGTGNSGPCDVAKDSLNITINQAPIVNAGIDITICESDTAFLNGSFGGSATSITWSGGTGTFENINGISSYYIPSSSEIAAGSATLTITTNDPDLGGPCSSVTDNVTIFINKLPTVDAGSDQIICETSIANLSGTIGSTATSAIWTTSGDGTFSFNGDLNASYTPGSNDKTNNFAWLYLTTNNPSGPCPARTDSLFLQINTQAISNPGTYAPVCIGDTVFLNGSVSGSAASATWSGGIGVFGNVNQLNTYYVPNQLEAGTTVLLALTTNDPSGPCSADVKQTAITVNQLPLVEFFGLDASYQEDDPAETLTGFPDNSGIFSGPGIVSMNLFDPSTAGNGTHDIVYTYIDGNGCVNSRTRQTVVFDLPAVTPTNPGPLCTNSSIKVLEAVPDGGVWSGPGVFQDTDGKYKIDPGLVSSNTHTLTYTYTDINGSVVAVPVPVIVYSEPVVDFTIDNFCVADPIQFNDISYMAETVFPGDTITRWEWDFGDQTEIDTLPSPQHLFSESKLYSVSVTVTTKEFCPKTPVSKNVTIGGVPDANFFVNDIAFGDNTTFTENSTFPDNGLGQISNVRWDLGDGTMFSGTKSQYGTVEHMYLDSGTFDIELIVETNWGCSDTIMQPLSILPQVSNYPYFQDFETSSGWIAGGTNSSWEVGLPMGPVIDHANSGSNAWVTNLSGTYNPDESSFVYSPSFDLRYLERPMISMATWSSTPEGFNGAVIQFSLDGGRNWANLGNSDDGYGLNWFNERGILGSPGESFNQGDHGWTGEDTTYVISRRHLDDLNQLWTFGFADLSAVRFRIAFGSISENPENVDGFAFDDFFIGSRTRNVLLENFTNLNNNVAILSNQDLYNVTDALQYQDEIILQYHLRYPQADQIYDDNSFPPDSRGAIYDLTTTPVIIMDGTQRFVRPGSTFQPTNLINNALKDPLFDINVGFTPSGRNNELTIDASVEPLVDSVGKVVVHVVPVEKLITDLGGELRYVVKDMLPTESGSIIEEPALNVPVEFHHLWNVSDMVIYDTTQLAVVVFVQTSGDEGDTKVLQAEMIDLPGLDPGLITGLDKDEIQNLTETIQVYPNPARDYINVKFPEIIENNLHWKLIDQKGAVYKRGKLDAGFDRYLINSNDIANGVYMLMLSDNHQINIRHKIIILK